MLLKIPPFTICVRYPTIIEQPKIWIDIPLNLISQGKHLAHVHKFIRINGAVKRNKLMVVQIRK